MDVAISLPLLQDPGDQLILGPFRDRLEGRPTDFHHEDQVAPGGEVFHLLGPDPSPLDHRLPLEGLPQAIDLPRAEVVGEKGIFLGDVVPLYQRRAQLALVARSLIVVVSASRPSWA